MMDFAGVLRLLRRACFWGYDKYGVDREDEEANEWAVRMGPLWSYGNTLYH